MRNDSSLRIMARMSLLVRPLMGFMLLAVLLGVAGFLCAIFIPVFGSLIIGHIAIHVSFPTQVFFIMILVLAVLRGVLHYGEQACNHYIAFRLLAYIRDKVFQALRRISPAKLEGKDKGDLVFLITSDIEALEVFYAHTISPVFIAILTSGGLLLFFYSLHPMFFLIALVAYVFVGICIPFLITKLGKDDGVKARAEFGELSSYTLESLRAMQEVLQYHVGEQRLEEMQRKSKALNSKQEQLRSKESISSILSGGAITIFSSFIFLCGVYLYGIGGISLTTLIVSTVLMISSFGPVLALSNLSNNLLVTIPSAKRVLAILDEKEIVKDVHGQEESSFHGILVEDVQFAYEDEMVLQNFQGHFEKGKITGIHGKSGSGKSTLLKLMMRFWEVDKGSIHIGKRPLDRVNTNDLRAMQSYVTQETVLFHDTILNNLRIARLDATPDEIEAACKKASIHEFIMSLPKQYNSEISELGDSLSGGEKQRLGIARAFLHDSACILLDEPTSNLDALNEAVILKSLQSQKEKTIILVSHRLSTLKIAHQVLHMAEGRGRS